MGHSWQRSAGGQALILPPPGIGSEETATQFNKTQKSPTSGFALLTDGVVDTLNNGGLFGPRQGHLLTIERLSTEYVFQFGLDKHKRIDTDPLFPPELFGKLFLRNG
jgi:hypothetical protein